MFFDQPIAEPRYLDPNPARRKCCGCMSLRAGCAIACSLWIGLNTYIATQSFQGYTAIFSFLNRPALIVFGSLSIVFAVVALLVLYGLFIDTPLVLQTGVIFLVLIIPVYLIDVAANIFVFGIQKSIYLDWCTESASKFGLYENVSSIANNGTSYNFTLSDPLPIYHCQKLWEDEIKFSIAVWIVMCICYIYWGMCVFYYYEKLRELFPPQSSYPNGNGFMNYLYAPSQLLPQYALRNAGPVSKIQSQK
ncbi:hypothetical protein BD560DRAFT_449713 [Blakeslea trispora]|nr:hypothetical protein BD560DRAFT_449713 [Blakeslea trispora]